MNKRKIVLLAVALCMAAILGMGSTLAYLTDEETATNVFTVGKVDIKLNENFTQDSLLMPGTSTQNNVAKEISITNTGDQPAYVRLHFAVPTILDSGDEDDPKFSAFDNMLHFNFGLGSMKENKWNWHSTQVYNTDERDGDWGYPENEGDWHFYKTTVPQTVNGKEYNVSYNVYVATWMVPLAPGATTDLAIRQVYLDQRLDNEDITNIIEKIGQIKVLVAAEAVQSAGFDGQPYKAFTDAYNVTELNGEKNLPYKSIFDMTIDYTGKQQYDNEAAQ